MDNPVNKRKFNIEEEERSASPEKLNETIRIGNAGGILLIAALVIAAASLIIWGFVGSIPITNTESVAVVGRESESNICIGFININENTGVFPAGTEVNLRMPDGKKIKGEISQMVEQPLSSEEIRKLFGDVYNPETDTYFLTDWILDNLLEDSKYSYMINILTQEDISRYWHQIAEATIITGEVKPISLLMS